jgi:hypothetical protein
VTRRRHPLSTPKGRARNFRQAQRRLAAYDYDYGRWDADRRCYVRDPQRLLLPGWVAVLAAWMIALVVLLGFWAGVVSLLVWQT